MIKYSIIFIVENEDSEFGSFFDLICDLFRDKGSFEIVIVENNAEKFVAEQFSDAQFNSERKNLFDLKIVTFQQKVSSSNCIMAALKECNGSEILAIGSFQELSSESYRIIVNSLSEDVDFVVPFRKKRIDPLLNRIHSALLNKAIKFLIGVQLHDIGCSTRFFRRKILDSINLYGNMYQYFPALASRIGFKVKEIECDQQEKARKTRFYSLKQYVDRLSGILNLFFMTNFSKKPLRFFSAIGSLCILFGVFLLLYVFAKKIVLGVPVGENLLLILSIIIIVGGAQIFSFGLLGEIISFVQGRSHKEYNIEKII